MLDSILAQNGSIAAGEVAICTIVSIILGLIIAAVYMFRSSYNKSFIVTLALLPVIVQSVILVVNGNLGTGVAVMGAFSLIRFRSTPGTAKEILAVFFTMAAGLACGMGYVVYAALFTAVVSIAMLLLATVRFGESKGIEKNLHITIPEDMDYAHLFDDIFKEYTNKHTLHKVRTTNLGGLYELQYKVSLKNLDLEKSFIDELRKRNGNLTISCGMPVSLRDEL